MCIAKELFQSDLTIDWYRSFNLFMNLTSLSRCLNAQMMARSCAISFHGNPVILLAENPRFIRENMFQMNLEYAGCKTYDNGTRSHCQGNLYSYSVEQDHAVNNSCQAGVMLQ